MANLEPELPAPADDPPSDDPWNGPSGEGWARNAHVIDAALAEATAWILERFGAKTGERLLDLGCGTGGTSMELARAVGADGRVLGLDRSAPMLAEARRRAARAGLEQVRFRLIDLELEEIGHQADAAFSRFGVMFFADPPRAFRNVAQALPAGARLGFLAWAEREANPFFTTSQRAIAQVLEREPPPFDPREPGPFAFSDPERVAAYLATSGFEDARWTRHDFHFRFPTAEAVWNLQREISSNLGQALQGLDEDVVDEIAAAAVRGFESFRAQKGIRVPATAWWFEARRAPGA